MAAIFPLNHCKQSNQELWKVAINRAFSCDVITFEIMKENGKQLPCWCKVQRDRSFYGDLHEMSDTLIICVVELDEILFKLKQLLEYTHQ